MAGPATPRDSTQFQDSIERTSKGGGLKRPARWFAVAGVVAVIGVLAAVVAFAGSWTTIRQPIAFPHALHVDEVGMECLDCHRYATSLARATIPNIEVCIDCHQEPQGDSAAEASVVRHVQAGEPIRWQKVTVVPEHVFFSHRRHTAIAAIACERCHGPVGARQQPLAAALVSLKMDDCMRCHEESGASNDCILCHR